jgi:hypothetical protein
MEIHDFVIRSVSPSNSIISVKSIAHYTSSLIFYLKPDIGHGYKHFNDGVAFGSLCQILTFIITPSSISENFVHFKIKRNHNVSP